MKKEDILNSMQLQLILRILDDLRNDVSHLKKIVYLLLVVVLGHILGSGVGLIP